MNRTAKEKRTYSRVLYVLMFVLAAILNLTGCASQLKGSEAGAEVLPPPLSVQAEEPEYILRPSDVISVSFFYFPRLDTTLKIRPDGYISMAPIDDVKAAGLTVRALDERLTGLYADRVENPELTVTVKEFASQKIYVGGEVRGGGIYDMETNMTALSAIFRAGGALDTGNLESVIVIRKKTDGAPLVMSINLEQDIKSRKIQNDIWLQPLDVIYVPKTLIAKIDQFVDQYIDKLLPISLNAGFSFIKDIDDNDSTVTVVSP